MSSQVHELNTRDFALWAHRVWLSVPTVFSTCELPWWTPDGDDFMHQRGHRLSQHSLTEADDAGLPGAAPSLGQALRDLHWVWDQPEIVAYSVGSIDPERADVVSAGSLRGTRGAVLSVCFDKVFVSVTSADTFCSTVVDLGIRPQPAVCPKVVVSQSALHQSFSGTTPTWQRNAFDNLDPALQEVLFEPLAPEGGVGALGAYRMVGGQLEPSRSVGWFFATDRGGLVQHQGADGKTIFEPSTPFAMARVLARVLQDVPSQSEVMGDQWCQALV